LKNSPCEKDWPVRQADCQSDYVDNQEKAMNLAKQEVRSINYWRQINNTILKAMQVFVKVNYGDTKEFLMSRVMVVKQSDYYTNKPMISGWEVMQLWNSIHFRYMTMWIASGATKKCLQSDYCRHIKP